MLQERQRILHEGQKMLLEEKNVLLEGQNVTQQLQKQATFPRTFEKDFSELQ